MINKKNYIATVVTLVLFWGLSFLVYFHIQNVKQLKHYYDNSKRLTDSLSSEIIYKDIEIGRYEIILDRIQKKNPALLDEVITNLE